MRYGPGSSPESRNRPCASVVAKRQPHGWKQLPCSPTDAPATGLPPESSTWNAALSRYEITISGVNYHFLSYATVVTPSDPALPLSPSTNSIGGQTLLVYFRNASGFPVQTHFGFVTYDP